MEMKACICLALWEGQKNPELRPVANSALCKMAAFTASDLNSTSIK